MKVQKTSGIWCFLEKKKLFLIEPNDLDYKGLQFLNICIQVNEGLD